MAAQPTIVVMDYHKGNLSSVARGLARAGAHAVISDDPAAVRAADGVVIPGVGSFYDAIEFMAESGQAAAVLDAAATGTPLLGICLGLQLLFDRGDELVPEDAPLAHAADAYGTGLPVGTVFEAGGTRWVRGLGLLSGSCTRLDGSRLKVPHVGWDQVHVSAAGRENPLLAGFPEGANMYFTHSYAVDDDALAQDVSARTHYVRSFPCVVQRGSVFGCQFHPEKSSARGLDILRNFVAIVAGSAGAVDVAGAAGAAGIAGAAGAGAVGAGDVVGSAGPTGGAEAPAEEPVAVVGVLTVDPAAVAVAVDVPAAVAADLLTAAAAVVEPERVDEAPVDAADVLMGAAVVPADAVEIPAPVEPGSKGGAA